MNEKTYTILPFNIYSHKKDLELIIIGIKCHAEIQKMITSAIEHNAFQIASNSDGVTLKACNIDFIFDLSWYIKKVAKRNKVIPSYITFTFIDEDGKLQCGRKKFIYITFDNQSDNSRSDS
ncbi:hypothetical protein [Citrobacter meridianamericanus]|uniref:Uncharacterized protein n=1 Tax=Citrobacter meridianamericanus TaxID=2894201 RepID=A0ABT1B774_9ENTR|nr:hypothetical protein [Citrobacter meridianamericanus]MCO5781383.1 hypothetical protein [Citrobacter meridianamericanus]